MFISSLIKGTLHPLAFSLRWWIYRLFARFIPDENYIAWQYRKRLGQHRNLQNPETFNEKIQWLKLHFRPAVLTQCADKYEVRKFVNNRVGTEILNELYGVYNHPEDINLDTLPDAFVLKVNHGCKQNIICTNKQQLDWYYAMRMLKHWLKVNNYFHSREWAYKNITPKIICERYLNEGGKPLKDYKISCFGGVPRFISVHTDRYGTQQNVSFFDVEWNYISSRKHLHQDIKLEKPKDLDKMIDYARRLSEGFPFVRVDFYYVNQKIYFGEMTFYPAGGIKKFVPEEYDAIFGSYLQLPQLQ